jgi:hypothetical protein
MTDVRSPTDNPEALSGFPKFRERSETISSERLAVNVLQGVSGLINV